MGHRSDSGDDVTLERARSSAAGPARSRAAARLVVVHPPTLRGVVALSGESTTVGRQARSPGDAALVHPTISRAHAELRRDPASDRHWLRDLGSRNGTCLEGQAIGELPRPLVDGAVIRFGDVIAVYERAEGGFVDAAEVDHAAAPGHSAAAASLRAALSRVAGRSGPALVIGETGAGKERIAAELQRLRRRAGPLVVANCAALSPTLIESQLFGHERGAFTGAAQRASGLFRGAEGGTLVLDEIGELALELQPKLLRALESGEVMAVGATRAARVDVQVIGVTNRDLAVEVEAGRFRRDLYARLALGEVRVPPLRARRADVLEWLDRLAPPGAPPSERLSASAAEALVMSGWPENLRGVHRLALELAGLPAPIGVAMVPRWVGPPELVAGGGATGESAAEDDGAESGEGGGRVLRPRPSREELLRALEEHGWSVRATARYFERDRKQISRWIERYGIVMPGRE